jgi:cAMP-dependent protein kinase regulator
MDNSEYCETKLKDIVEELLLDLAKKKPCDIINYSMDWLMKKGGYTINGLTIDERDDLLRLRKELKKYRELHQQNNKGNDSLDEDQEEYTDEEDDHVPEVHHNKKTSVRGPRIAVSAEAYGEFNKKGDFKPVVHQKLEDQITAIKSRLIHSFMFNSLESCDLKIVIDAMEENKFVKGDIIINQGDQGDCLYIVEEGEFDCFKKFVSEYFLIYFIIKIQSIFNSLINFFSYLIILYFFSKFFNFFSVMNFYFKFLFVVFF